MYPDLLGRYVDRFTNKSTRRAGTVHDKKKDGTWVTAAQNNNNLGQNG